MGRANELIKDSISKKTNVVNRKWISMLFIALLFLGACTKKEPVKEPQVTQPVEVVKKTPFEAANIVTVEFREVSQPVESVFRLYEVVSTNHSDEEIIVDYYSYESKEGGDGGGVGRTVGAGQSVVTLLQSTLDLTGKQATHYGYRIQDDANMETRYNITVLSGEFMKQTTDIRKSNRVYILPLVPNSGVTIFAWKQDNKWLFDYARGIEYTGWKPLQDENLSLVNSLNFFESDTAFLYIQTADKKMNDAERKYVKEQMDFILQYMDFEYVLEGEEDQFDRLNQKYPYMETIRLVDKGQNNCTLTYCAFRAGYTLNDYAFDSNTREQIGKRSFTMKEFESELKQYKDNYYNIYVKGKDKQLTEKEAIELDKLFREQDYWSYVENMKYVGADKPVIYLYPEKETDVHVQLDYRGELTTTYPQYESRNNDGWRVIAKPDGTLLNKADNQEYSYLFWEGIGQVHYQMNEGFVVKKEDTVKFLQDKLSYLGLLPKEYNDFIVYWLPLLNENNYNLISFQEDAYTDIAKLNITPAPDSIQRLFMTFKGLNKPIDIKPQQLQPFNREGFTVIEWGGVEITN